MRMREKIIEFTFEVKWVEARHTTSLTHYQEHQSSLQKRRNLQSIVQLLIADKSRKGQK